MKKQLCALSLLLILFNAKGIEQSTTSSRYTTNPKITIIGVGYVGLVSGAGLAELGNQVMCTDIDTKKIEMLNTGTIPIYEPGLKEIVDHNVATGRLSFTTNVLQALDAADVIFICVGTPMADNGAADLSYIQSTVEMIARALKSYKVIVTKSTVPTGTGAWIRSLLQAKGIDGASFDVVSNPEFLREGTAVKDFLAPDRIVIGAESERAFEIMNKVYEKMIERDVPLIRTNLVASETIKYASNAFLAIKLSYINEIANLCDETGADAKAVAQGMGLDKRINPYFLNPGPGFGGSCFPKDSRALLYMAQLKGIDLHTVNASLIANETQKKKPFEKLVKILGEDLSNKTIAILGLAFKANTDDIRCSPSITTIELLLKHGAKIQAYDPAANETMRHVFPDITYCRSAYQAAKGTDAIIIMTEWEEFKYLDLAKIGTLTKSRILIDTRNILPINEFKKHNYTFDVIGRRCLSCH